MPYRALACVLLALAAGPARAGSELVFQVKGRAALVRPETGTPGVAAPSVQAVAAPVGHERRLFEDTAGRHGVTGALAVAVAGVGGFKAAQVLSTLRTPLFGKTSADTSEGGGLAPLAAIREGGALVGIQGRF